MQNVKAMVQNRLSGITNFELTYNGKKQTKIVAERLKEQKIDKVYSSPLNRALQQHKKFQNMHMKKGL